MNDFKRFKDPVYGYIHIENHVMGTVVDSAIFQRLRRIVQTSYAPLYASAVHNRFVHSIGVYHLSKMVIERLKQPINQKAVEHVMDLENWERSLTVFSYAALLHDVGHAPFSHTGEDFYLENKKGYEKIHQELTDLVDYDEFKDDINAIKPGKEAKPHEIVSAIVGLKEFSSLFFSAEERALFARCITGYRYREENYTVKNIYNCLIEMLNSAVIDIDKLDYLIRDAYITGYDTVKIDYQRLLSAVTIVEKNDSSLCLAYDKSAISVIENVIYAHDAEGHWIQTHPVVTYESYLLEAIVEELNSFFSGSRYPLFSLQSLSENGNVLTHYNSETQMSQDWKVRLLSDDDIVCMLKNFLHSEVSCEYLSRNMRRHAMWKSEAEYQAYFYKQVGRDSNMSSIIETAFSKVSVLVKNSTHKDFINEEAYKRIKRDYDSLSKGSIDGLSDRQRTEKLKDYETCVQWLECFQDFCAEEGIPFDLLFLSAKQFTSSFMKSGYENAMIYVEDHPNKIVKYSDIITVMSRKPPIRKEFYYVFYKRDGEKKVNVHRFFKKMMRTATEIME